jgi:hypothetical protein
MDSLSFSRHPQPSKRLAKHRTWGEALVEEELEFNLFMIGREIIVRGCLVNGMLDGICDEAES